MTLEETNWASIDYVVDSSSVFINIVTVYSVIEGSVVCLA